MEVKDKISNVTSKVISSIWGTLEQFNFDFTFKNGKTTLSKPDHHPINSDSPFSLIPTHRHVFGSTENRC